MSLAADLRGLSRAAKNVKVLTIDVERYPGRWRSWDNQPRFLRADQMIQPPRIFCFAAKWLHEKQPVTVDERGGHEQMTRAAWDLLSEADVVVTYNGTKADIPWLNEHFLDYNLGPAAPFKHVDLIKSNRQRFNLPYRSLDYLSGRVLGAAKMRTEGDLWTQCEAGDEAAYRKMLAYNVKDIALTEQLYLELIPWLTDQPHMGQLIDDGEAMRCAGCGHKLTEKDRWQKPARAYVRSYALYRCARCGSWNRSTFLTGKPLLTRPVK